MADGPRLIIQVARDGAVHRQLTTQPPQSLASGQVLVQAGPADAKRHHLEPPDAGKIVLTVPSPETLVREADEVRRVIKQAGTGVEPLVVVVEAAEELREEELASLLEAAGHSSRPVILRVIRDA